MLSYKLHTRIGEQDLLLQIQATSSSPPLAVKAGWWARIWMRCRIYQGQDRQSGFSAHGLTTAIQACRDVGRRHNDRPFGRKL
jgi:hypothetical protein